MNVPKTIKGIIIFSVLICNSSYGQFNPVFKLSNFNSHDGIKVTNVNETSPPPLAIEGELKIIGDINDDGQSDLMTCTSAITVDGQLIEDGCFVIYGQVDGINNSLDLSDINGTNGFAINWDIPDSGSVNSYNGSGDFNNDGISDLVLGAANASLSESAAGAVFIVFGQASNFPTVFNLSSLNGTNGFYITGTNSADGLGSEVNFTEDFNGDQIDDLIISAPNSGNSGYGAVYTFYGVQQGQFTNTNVSALNGTNGFAIIADHNHLEFGETITAADINNDGLSDYIIGAVVGHPITNFVTYVVFGDDIGFSSEFDLTGLNGSNGFVIDAIDQTIIEDTFFHIRVNQAGDMNQDGIDDMVVSFPTAVVDGESYVGTSYVIFGSGQPFLSQFDLNNIDGNNGFKVVGDGAYHRLGSAIESLGDINNDGIDDLLVSSLSEPNGQLEPWYVAYVIYGKNNGYSSSIAPSLMAVDDGFVIESFDHSTFSIPHSYSKAGDVNSDGIADFSVVSPQEAYIIFGKGDLIFTDSFE